MNAVTQNALVIDGGVARVFDDVENDGPMWAGTGKRWARTAVRFAERFNSPPTVQLSIALIDTDSGRNLRLELYTEDVTAEGFTAVAHTWKDTRIGRLHVSWTALGTGDAEIPGTWPV